jgi:hypothetical protein
MCPIGADFKHFPARETRNFRHLGNISSIMHAKVLSIMEGVSTPVTAL